ncbi:uncharacterized protein IL334_007418 [Kwoniella shivajii]|uniref:NmrA-like domain-containing protein n=1 Tax=Kwoniella shivajii TaxID=564305 RepID=A0ABZ1D8L5_9TREE|nr:hypothetical protein IL334_007418 [Kwoniella shivajii]
MTRSVLIIGAGELGLALIDSFTTHPSKSSVSVLLRPSSKTDLSSYPVKIVHGDISLQSSDFSYLLKGFDIVILATGFSAGPGTQLRVAQAVLEAKVPHYIPWQYGVDYDVIGRGSSQPLFDEQLDVRDLLRSQEDANGKTSWTIISTGMFTDTLFGPALGIVDLKNGVVHALEKWDNRLTVTSSEDIGYLTARIALNQEDIPQGVIFIAGDTVNFADIAKEVERAGWKINRKVISIEDLERRLKLDPDDLGAKYGLIWARNKGVSWPVEDSWNGKNGMKTETIKEWIEKHLPKP